MAALKAILKNLDGIADGLKEYYRKDGEDYLLDVEGLVAKEKLDEFRDRNNGIQQKLNEATEALKKFEGVDLKKWKDLQETDRRLRDKELIEAGKFDELLSSKIDPILKKHADEKKAQEEALAKKDQQLARVMIDQELTKIATAKGLRPEAIPDMLGRLRGDFTIVGDKVVSLDPDGNTRRTDGGVPYTLETGIEGLSKAAPHLFQPSNGSGANNGTGGTNGHGGKTITRADFNKLDYVQQMATAKEATAGKIKIVDAA